MTLIDPVLKYQVEIGSGYSAVQLPNGYAYDAGDVVSLTQEQFDQLASNAFTSGVLIELGAPVPAAGSDDVTLWTIPVDLTGVVDGTVKTFAPALAGTILSVSAVVTADITGTTPATTLNLDIGGTNVTGGAVTLDNTSDKGETVAGTAVTAANVITADDSIVIEAASTAGTFTGGSAVLVIVIVIA